MSEEVAAKYPCDLIVFGTFGDFSCCKLLPALYQLERNYLLHPDTRINYWLCMLRVKFRCLY
ncbi:hypothetical protein [Legionella sp.]|uniref:hypothetical protein n=1 Tax=Legionella sp. TaxID=459 RepID=UPI003CC5AA17